jgi:hypothetical protein
MGGASQTIKITTPAGFTHNVRAAARTQSEIIQNQGCVGMPSGGEAARGMHAQRATKAIGQGSASAGRSRPTIRPDRA